MNFRSHAVPVLVAFVLPMFAMGLTQNAQAASTDVASPAPAVSAPAAGLNRYMVVRTFPAGALDGLDAAGENAVNSTNAKYSVHWVHSYANADKTKTFCIYEGPNEKSIRDAARANNIPLDYVVEIPVVLGAH